MTPLLKRTLEWILKLKGKVLLQLFNKSKLRNVTKTFLDQNFALFIIKFKKLRFSCPFKTELGCCNEENVRKLVIWLC